MKTIRFEIFFAIAALICIPILWQFLPGSRWPEGTQAHAIMKIIYWICSVGVIAILIQTKTYKGNIIGTIMAVIFGPITLLTIGITWLYVRVTR